MAKMNKESRYNAIMSEASRIYRELTLNAFDNYVCDCQMAGERYKASTGDVLEAQDVCRDEIEDAGDAYDDAVHDALVPYIHIRDEAWEAYRNTEKRP